MSLYILIDHGGTKLIYALTLISFQGGMIIGALIASFKKKWGNRMMIIFLGIVFGGIGYIIFSIAPTGAFFIIGIGGLILGIMLPIINSLYQTWIQTIVPKDKIGRVTSIDHTLSMSIAPIATILTGPLATLMGNANLLFYSALLMIAITILIWSFSSVRRINYDDPNLITEINSNIGKIKIK
jgi:Na+/melibiose symporter-like transporter